MNSITNNALLMMERSMDFLWTKQTAILDNLANVETPNYKTKYVTFEETFRSRLQAASNGSASDMRDALENTQATIHVADNETARMARNALQQQHVMNAISTDLSLIRTAIRGQ